MARPHVPSAAEAPSAATLQERDLTLQLLEWIDRQPRSYRETIEAWQTHCPRFTIWEDAHSASLVRIECTGDAECPVVVVLTAKGSALLRWERC